MSDRYDVVPIGHVKSPLRIRAETPKQGDEGAPTRGWFSTTLSVMLRET